MDLNGYRLERAKHASDQALRTRKQTGRPDNIVLYKLMQQEWDAMITYNRSIRMRRLS